MTDDAIIAVYAALAGAFAEMPAIDKGKTAKVETKGGGGYSYTYADLADLFAAVRPVLAKHDLFVTQDVTTVANGVAVSTLIAHKGGGVIRFGPLVMPSGGTPQALGSAITYQRRYALLAALGIATEDDDGQAAAQVAQERTRTTRSNAARARQAPAHAEPAPVVLPLLFDSMSEAETMGMSHDEAREFVGTLLDLIPEDDALRAHAKQDFLRSVGCPPKDMADPWSGVLWLISRGAVKFAMEGQVTEADTVHDSDYA